MWEKDIIFDEVIAVDKYEYKLKTQEMLELMEDGEYSRAAEIADIIDWKRVRNVTMLMNVSDIYEKNDEYKKSYDVLRIAYHRAEGSRKVLYRLCSLAIKTGNVEEAIDYYDDFMQIAPKDPNQYILRYQILRAQNAPIEQQIEALEEFKKAEYIEEWAYELAKLYQEAGMITECLEECDDLILWFSEGKYVYKAMELKMQYKPLTPSQQEKYDKRSGKISTETEEIPDLETYAASQEEEGTVSEEEKDSGAEPEESETLDRVLEHPGQEKGQKKIGDTMRLDEALKQLLQPKMDSDITEITPPELEEDQEEEPVLTEEPAEASGETDMADLEDAIGEIESVVDLEMVNQIAEEKELQEKVPAASGMTELVPEEAEEIVDVSAQETVSEEEEESTEASLDITEAEEFLEDADEEQNTEDATETSADSEQVEGQMSFADILSDWELQMEDSEDLTEEEEPIEAVEAEVVEEDTASGMENAAASPEDTEALEADDAEAYEEAEELEADDSEEYEEAEELEADDSEEYEEVEELEADDSEEYEEAEELKADESEEYEEAEELEADESEEYEEAEELEADDSEEYDDTEELETDDYEEFEEEASEEETWGDTEESEDDEAEPAEAEQEDLTEGETAGEIMENKKKTEPILPPDIQRLIDEIEGVIPPEEPKPVKKETTDDVPHENMGKVADELRIDDDLELDDSEDYWDDDYDEPDSVYEDEEEYGRDYADEAEEEYYSEYEDEDDIYDNEMPDFEEEFRVNPEHSTEPDDREVPDDDDEEMDILSATTPLSRKETAKLIATGKTSPLPLDEISDALSLSDTGFVVHGRYDLEAQSGIGTRAGLTDEQKKLFSYFVPVRGMSEQLVDVLEQDKNCTNRRGTSRTGNLLIIGNKGNGKTVLAVDVVKAIQKQRNIRQGKVAIVTGESLNKKKIGDIIDKLYGGALIIEKAGKMNEKTVARLNKAMEKDTGELLIVLEEQRKPLDRLLSSNREFRRKFTSRLEVPIFINDELVTFGQTYAQENGYRIDEMGILALYSRIDSLQREDHAVTVAEVKEIMDEAIQHSQKASAKKLVRRVFGKNTDDSDRILLSEKDFNI